MLALWIFLGLLILIGLLLVVPLRIFLRYDAELHFRIKYGPILVYNSEKPPKQKPQSSAPAKKKPKSSGIGKLLDFLGLTEISSVANVKGSIHRVGIVGTLQAVSIALKRLFLRISRLVRKGKFKKFRLSILVGDEDGGDAALQYGRVCAVAFPLLSFIKGVMHFSEQQLDIRCDYDIPETVVHFEGQLNYLPWHFVCFALWLIANYIKNSMKKEKAQ